MRQIIFEFPDSKLADIFLNWLSNSGEQDFMDHCEYHYPETDGEDNHLYHVDINYWGGSDDYSNVEFGTNPIVVTVEKE